MFKIWYVIWPGVWNIFSKFHHTHEHKQSSKHQQGLIELIWYIYEQVPVKWSGARVG